MDSILLLSRWTFEGLVKAYLKALTIVFLIIILLWEMIKNVSRTTWKGIISGTVFEVKWVKTCDKRRNAFITKIEWRVCLSFFKRKFSK